MKTPHDSTHRMCKEPSIKIDNFNQGFHKVILSILQDFVRFRLVEVTDIRNHLSPLVIGWISAVSKG